MHKQSQCFHQKCVHHVAEVDMHTINEHKVSTHVKLVEIPDGGFWQQKRLTHQIVWVSETVTLLVAFDSNGQFVYLPHVHFQCKPKQCARHSSRFLNFWKFKAWQIIHWYVLTLSCLCDGWCMRMCKLYVLMYCICVRSQPTFYDVFLGPKLIHKQNCFFAFHHHLPQEVALGRSLAAMVKSGMRASELQVNVHMIATSVDTYLLKMTNTFSESQTP